MTNEEKEQIIEEFCDLFCKFPGEYLMKHSDPDEASAEMVREVCRKCPLERLRT